ncbi:helix-turn-helix domain-containing protein [Streptomyces glaucescens]|uniref:helix-turn-helix domain-containing protein n=1 Tax=Streptomyces glaucescens TaxID=1907 RepID=UPI00344F70B5
MSHRSPALSEIRTAAELAAELRELKARSRLTYRQLEERAARSGELLPRSTLADVLRHGTLPRPELLTAFVRACGEGDAMDEWLAARERAAQSAGQTPATRTPEDDGLRTGVEGRRPRPRSSDPWVVGGAVLAVALSAAGVWLLSGSGEKGTALPGDEVHIRPVRAPGLCLTDGHVADGRYGSLVAVQRPCSEAVPPTTTLDRVESDTYRIVWYHPEHGKGCLKVLTSGGGKGLLEPWENCRLSTLFRFVPAESRAPKVSGRMYRIQVTDSACVTAAGLKAGAEAVVAPCGRSDAQVFVVEAAVTSRDDGAH